MFSTDSVSWDATCSTVWPKTPSVCETGRSPILPKASMKTGRSMMQSMLATAALFALSAIAQSTLPVAQPAQSGASTGAAGTPVYDAQHRPITAGGFVSSGRRIFADVAETSGLTSWRQESGSPTKRYIIDTVGSGVALLDYDNDGWLDIYLVNGSTYDAQAGTKKAPQSALFHNNHDGTFTNVAGKAGVTNDRWGFGVAVGDYDNDGWPDLYVTNFGENRLYHNNHDGTFTDVAAHAQVQVGAWSTGATFGDYDGDGKLDLFVPGYVKFDLSHPPEPGTQSASFYTCQFRGIVVSCGPRGLEGERDHLFHNNGDGTFTDVSSESGVDDPHHYYGFTSLFADVNNDGKPDLLVTNDSTPSYLYLNDGHGKFVDTSDASGFAYNGEGREIAGMGLAAGDYLNNGRLDLAVTNFSDDYKVLYRNDGKGQFTDVSAQAGIADKSVPFLGWGIGFIDYDNDGWMDLFMVNGHIYPAVDAQKWGTSYKERPLLFHNLLGHRFALVPAVEGSGLAVVTSARGAAFGDLWNDGKIDVIINNLDGTPSLLRNINGDHNAWLELKLIGGPKSPRDAVGTTVLLTAGGMTRRQDVLSGGSFMSSNDPRVHFGLGNVQRIERVEIRWPSGAVEQIKISRVDAIYTIQEGVGVLGVMESKDMAASKPEPRKLVLKR
jgi:hypothetical protein